MKPEAPKELGAGRVAFLARKDAIKERIDAGRTVMSVYREYQKQVEISYSQFDRYVNKFIRGKPDGKPPTEAPSVKAGDKKPINKQEHGQPKFIRTENRDDLFKPKPKE